MVSCGEVVAAVPDYNQLKDKMFCSKSRAASKPERLTQVHLTDLGVGKDFFRSAGGDYSPLVDDVRPRAHSQRLADIMVSDQYADAALGELADDALDVQDRERVDAGEGLIQQHEPGLGRERPGDLDTPSLPAGEREPLGFAHMADAQLREQLLEALFARGPLHLTCLEDRHDVVLNGQLAEHRGFLRQVAEAELRAAMDRQQGQVDFAEHYAPRIARHEPDDHVE